MSETGSKAAVNYIQNQTARRLVEGVARDLENGRQAAEKLGRPEAEWYGEQAGKLRDALVLMVGNSV